MSKFIFIPLVFLQLSFAQASLLIPHEQFVKLDEKKKRFYVMELRKALVEVVKAKYKNNKTKTSFKKNPLFDALLNEVWADETKNAKKGIPAQECINAGYKFSVENNTCGEKKTHTNAP